MSSVLAELGAEKGGTRWGRSPRAELRPHPTPSRTPSGAIRRLRGAPDPRPARVPLGRMIEMLDAAEDIKDLLHDEDILGGRLCPPGERAREGIG